MATLLETRSKWLTLPFWQVLPNAYLAMPNRYDYWSQPHMLILLHMDYGVQYSERVIDVPRLQNLSASCSCRLYILPSVSAHSTCWFDHAHGPRTSWLVHYVLLPCCYYLYQQKVRNRRCFTKTHTQIEAGCCDVDRSPSSFPPQTLTSCAKLHFDSLTNAPLQSVSVGQWNLIWRWGPLSSSCWRKLGPTIIAGGLVTVRVSSEAAQH
jgi:hypothetical protein